MIPKKVNITSADGGKPAKAAQAADGAVKDKILRVAPELINTNPLQPRHEFSRQPMEELVDSIKQYGIIQPLVVSVKNGRYELIAGERRLRASKIAGLKEVPVIVREAEEREKLELALVENLQRENLNPIEQARAYKKLMDEFSFSQEEISKKVGRARPSVANSLRLLSLPEEIQRALAEGRISEGHAKIIVGLDSEAKQLALYNKIIRANLSVDTSMKEARVMGGTKAARIKPNYADKSKEEILRGFFGAKTEIKRKGRGGRIIIDFYSDDELAGIMEKVAE